MPVRVSAQARPGDVFEGRVAAIAPEVDARNRHFAIEVRVPNPTNVLLSGMYGSAAIPLERAAQVVAVPRDAVTTRNGARVALKIDHDTIREVPVTEGLANAAVVQIAAGLQTGDTIVSDARRDVAAGVKVNPVFVKQ
jgi:RND family efflux transporter MFP subunit